MTSFNAENISFLKRKKRHKKVWVLADPGIYRPTCPVQQKKKIGLEKSKKLYAKMRDLNPKLTFETYSRVSILLQFEIPVQYSVIIQLQKYKPNQK